MRHLGYQQEGARGPTSHRLGGWAANPTRDTSAPSKRGPEAQQATGWAGGPPTPHATPRLPTRGGPRPNTPPAGRVGRQPHTRHLGSQQEGARGPTSHRLGGWAANPTRDTSAP